MKVPYSYIVLALFFVLSLLFLSNYIREGFYQQQLVPPMNTATLFCCDNGRCSTTPCNEPKSLIEISLSI
jgi:hypothetical protein